MEQFLFFGGIAVAGVALFIAFVTALLLLAGKRRLNKQLDTEYGPEPR